MDALVKTKRNSSVEILRFLFMFSIVLLHVYGHGSHLNYEWIYSLGSSFQTAHHLAIFSFCKIGVTGFMFISGYYGIRMNRKKLITIVLLLIFYAALLLYFNGGGILLILHPFDGWWYVSCYIFICIMSPLIEDSITRIGKQDFRYIVITLLAYTYFAHFIGMNNDRDVSFLLTIYITARYLKIYPSRWYLKFSTKIGFAAFLCLCILPIMASYLHVPFKFMKLFVQNNNILLLILAASLVIWAEKKHCYLSVINYLASSMLVIYLITDYPPIRTKIDPLLLVYVLNGSGFFIIFGLCLACLCFDKVRECLFDLAYRLYLILRKELSTANLWNGIEKTKRHCTKGFRKN